MDCLSPALNHIYSCHPHHCLVMSLITFVLCYYVPFSLHVHEYVHSHLCTLPRVHLIPFLVLFILVVLYTHSLLNFVFHVHLFLITGTCTCINYSYMLGTCLMPVQPVHLRYLLPVLGVFTMLLHSVPLSHIHLFHVLSGVRV